MEGAINQTWTHRSSNSRTLRNRKPVPPNNILVFLPIDRDVIVARFALIRTPSYRIAVAEHGPIDRRPRQVPPSREIGLPQAHDPTFFAGVGDGDAVDGYFDVARGGVDVDAVVGVFGVVVDGGEFFEPLIWMMRTGGLQYMG